MNKVFIVGNLTRDPELRSTRDGISVCSFTVAVNRRVRNAEAGQPEADFFRVSAWRALGENCAKYLAKGRKVAVVGAVSVSTYTGNDGQTRASMDITAQDVEFLTPKSDNAEADYNQTERTAMQHDGMSQTGGGFVEVDSDDLPF